MGTGKKRIAYLRITQETNALSTVLTELRDFEQSHLLDGPALKVATEKRRVEVKGFTKNAELSGFRRAVDKYGDSRIEAVPIFSAWAISGGPLSEACFAHFLTRLRGELEAAAPLDGVFVAMHGAMGAEGHNDPESAVLAVCREVVGDAVPIAVTLDLHAQITRDNMRLADIICGYRTNPHRDHKRVGKRCGRILIDAVLGRARPTMAWRALPMVMGGGTTVDFLSTMRPLFRKMKRLEKRPGVRYVTLFMCHLWNDHPDLGWSTVVVTDDDPQLADEVADELAEAAWGVKDAMPPTFPSIEEAVAKVRKKRFRMKLGTACVCDASDVVGAGGTGENTRILSALLTEAQDLLSYVPVRDPSFVDRFWDGEVGSAIEASVGGRLQPEYNAPLDIRGKIQTKRKLDAFERCIVVDLDHVKLVVTEGPALVMKPRFYRDLGLEPMRAHICVVKSLFPFRLFFIKENRMSLYVKTRGITDMDLVTTLTFNDPVHPMEAIPDWRVIDKRRRGVS